MSAKGLILCLFTLRLAEAAQFMNLNFESVIQPLPPPDPVTQTVPAELALPGWDVFIGQMQVEGVMYNAIPGSQADVSIFSTEDPLVALDVISGNYSVFLGSGLISPLPTAASAAIAQMGLVPGSALSIELKASYFGPFDLLLGGELIPMVPRSGTPPGVTIYAGDISGHGGLVEELRISVPYTGIAPVGETHALLLDDIRFLAIPIPEPGLMVPVMLAGLAWVLVKRRSAKSKKSE